MLAVEKLELAAPLSQPLRWRMPTASVTPLGIRRLLFLDLVEISDGRGNAVQARKRQYGDKLEVLIPVQPLAGNTLRIAYQVRNAVRFRQDHDELYWPIGAGWPDVFQDLSADITVPDRAAGQISGQLLPGGAHSRAVRALAIQGTRATFELTGVHHGPDVPAIDLVFAPGVLQQPALPARAARFLQANPIVLFPGVLLLAMAGFRRYAHRAGKAEVSVAARYEPAEDLPPAEAGYLADGHLDHRDLAAMLLDLARRGFIRIEAGRPDEGLPYPGPDFVLRLLKPMDQWKGAADYEHTMLFHTFYGGQWTKLSSLSLRFYAVVPMIERLIQEELRRKRLYVDPRRVTAQRLAAVLLVVVLMLAAQAAGWFAVAQSGLLALVAMASFVLVVLLFTRGVDHRTARGAQVLAELRGFQMFLDSVEADRMERVTPELFERFLPYAVALGVEHHWAAAFSTISSGPPLWWDAAKSGGFSEFVHLVGTQAQPPRRSKRDSVNRPPAYPAATSG